MKAPWVSIIGWSGSGKTRLLAELLDLLRQRGLKVAAVKHTSDDHPLHRPGSEEPVDPRRDRGSREPRRALRAPVPADRRREDL